jgi:hypothetical protein
MIWIQVRDVHAGHARLAAAGVPIVPEPVAKPWGLTEMQIEDPDGIGIVLAEAPAGHSLRRDPRPALPPGRRTACRMTARPRGNAAAQRPPGMRQIRTFTPSAATHKHTAWPAGRRGCNGDCRPGDGDESS